MKKLQFLILFLYSNLIFSQQVQNINETTSHAISNSYLINDTLNVGLVTNMNHQSYTGSESFKKLSVAYNSGLSLTQPTLIDTNFLSVSNKYILLDSGQFFEAGTYHPNQFTSSGKIWFKNSMTNPDSVIFYQGLDTLYNGIIIYDVFKIKSSVYIFGGGVINNYPFREAFVIKHNLMTNNNSFSNYYCYESFCFISSAIYDSLNDEFIVFTPARIGDTIPPLGGGISKIDTNLNIVPNTSHTMDVNYNPWFGRPKYTYDYSADAAWVNDSVFLTAGLVPNMQQLPSQTPNPNPGYDSDVAVSQRSSTNLQEISSTKVYGKLDTAERQEPGNFILEKVDSNLFVAVTNSRYYNYTPEPWNTSLALFGLDTAGNKHWEYYMPYNDYCWAKNAHPTSDGGLWVSIQCSGNLNLQAGTYDYFGKVAYIDSIAYWPRIGTVGEREIKKEANHFVVYPNPTNDYLKVKQYGLITALNYEVYDQSGRLLRSKKSAEHLVEMNIQDLAKGFYILRISNKNGELIKAEKIVKQ
jgi:hypothetical protein